jgi:hypothetical protein
MAMRSGTKRQDVVAAAMAKNMPGAHLTVMALAAGRT